MKYNIQELKKSEIHLPDDFLYEAIFIPDDVEAPPKSIILQPDLQVYIKNFAAAEQVPRL